MFVTGLASKEPGMLFFAWYKTDVKRENGFLYVTTSGGAEFFDGKANFQKICEASFKKMNMSLTPIETLGNSPKSGTAAQRKAKPLDYCGQIQLYKYIKWDKALDIIAF